MLGTIPLALVQPLGKATSASITITNDDGTTETRNIDTTQIDAMVACGEQYNALADRWTLGFAGLGVLLGLVTDREDIGWVLPILLSGAKSQWTETGKCSSVFNALADAFVGAGACQATQWIRQGRSLWTGKKK